MTWDLLLLLLYRGMALVVAAAMVWTVLCNRDWRAQALAAVVLVPFLLRGLGVK